MYTYAWFVGFEIESRAAEARKLFFDIQIYVAYRGGYVLRNAPLGYFIVVRTCTILTQT